VWTIVWAMVEPFAVVRRAVVETIVETFVRRLYGQCMGNYRAVRRTVAEPLQSRS
jgi:hypothetical protein